jgi:uncharacterized protein DUF4405
MFRKIVATTLFVSFIAMATSGMMMFFVEKPSFTIQMHPVHKLFGLLMVISIISHLFFNYRSLLKHLKMKTVSVFGGFLVVLLFVLYGIALNNQLPSEIAEPMDALASQAESRR